MKYTAAIMAAALFGASAAHGAATGSCESKSASLKGSQRVTLVGEYDDGETSDWSGVYYMKVTISKGSSYSVWTDPNDDVTLDVYTNDEDAFVSFDVDSMDDGTQYARLAGSEWDVDDPSKVTFYVCVSGDIGTSVGVYSQAAWRSFVPVGSEDNKYSMSFSESAKTLSASFIDGEYWITSSLTKGRMYRVRTVGGVPGDPVAFEIDAEADAYRLYDDPEYASDTNNTAFVFSPEASGRFSFRVSSGTNDTFKLVYQMLKSRKVTEHPVTALESVGYAATFEPGREIANWQYADSIIDERLFSIKVSKGERWVFETEDASVPLKMAIYDSKGELVAENATLDGDSYDVRSVVEGTAAVAQTYYVGVCEQNVGPGEAASGYDVTLRAYRVQGAEGSPDGWDSVDDNAAGATGLEVLPGTAESRPADDGSTNGVHRLSATDWADVFVVAARKGITYRVGALFADDSETSPLPLKCEVFTLSGTAEKSVVSAELDCTPSSFVEFAATANAAYYVRMTVAAGKGLDYPGYNVRAVAYTSSGAALGMLTVNTPGAPSATWTLGAETVKYPGGSSVLVSGQQTVKLSAVTGYKAEVATKTVTVNPGKKPTVVTVKYSDTFDPRDDVPAGATALTLKNVDSDYATRTLWENDAADCFAITGMDGYLYDIALKGVEGDAVFSITNAQLGVLCKDVTSATQLEMQKTMAKYYLVVKHGTSAKKGGAYTLSGKFANVGAIKFAAAKVTSKENATSVKVTVNRTAKDGTVRVRYGTVAGSAKPGTDYVAQSGELVWENGDNKAKALEITLIPDLVPVYEGYKTFSVRIEPVPEEERAAGEYPAVIAGGNTCEVTLTDASPVGTTAEKAYAAKAPKLATVVTEKVALETGTYYGVVAEDGCSLTNGFPTIASVTLTASAMTPSTISAKVKLAGKTYSFSGKGWDEGEAGFKTKELLLSQKVNRIDEETGKSVAVTVTNRLVVTVPTGSTATAGAWKKGIASVELVMNVPDLDNKGYQEEITYRGSIYRNNAKVQEYLNVVTNFTGYYTVALAPEGVGNYEGIPAGNGYLTLTIDNKGTVKAAGSLADGTTKPTLSVAACALVPDDTSANGWSMLVPLYFAKSPAVFGGELRLYAVEDSETGAKTVVSDSTRPLVWRNDNAKLSYSGEDVWSIDLDPVGGWYDTVLNLQAYYLGWLFEVGTAAIDEFPSELATAGFSLTNEAEPSGEEVALAGDAFATAKKTLAKTGTLYDLAGGTNVCNVQVKVARATGLVTGSFSLWSANDAGTVQKEVTGFKSAGVLLLSRDPYATLTDDVVAPGFCTKSVTLQDYNEATKRTTSRSWTFSLPFNVIGIDQGEIDWWADDWGTEY